MSLVGVAKASTLNTKRGGLLGSGLRRTKVVTDIDDTIKSSGIISHGLTHSLTHSLTQSLTHSLIHSLTHLLVKLYAHSTSKINSVVIIRGFITYQG